MRREAVRVIREREVPAGYDGYPVGFALCLGLSLLAIVDIRRGFLFTDYLVETPYFVFSPLHLLMLPAGVAGMLISHRGMARYESRLGSVSLRGYVLGLALIVFGILVVDLFLYRGVAAARAAAAGKVGAGWLEAFGVTGWWRPLALGVSYLLTVWHATFLAVLLAGLALTILPRYLGPLFTRSGFGASLFGATFALPQPFCSCCASVISPSLLRRGASTRFTLAFVVGAPMLNLTTLILAGLLLPAPYALARILAGVILTVPVTYGVAWVSERWAVASTSARQDWLARWVSPWLNRYCRLFHLDELVRERRLDTPGAFLRAWSSVSGRIAVLLIPALLVWGIVAAALVQVLPSPFGNNLPSVVLAAAAGTLLMIPTWGEIPVAQQMIAAGFSGPAAALLITLPPVSLPCLMLLGGAMGKFRVAALLALTVTVVGVLAGAVFL